MHRVLSVAATGLAASTLGLAVLAPAHAAKPETTIISATCSASPDPRLLWDVTVSWSGSDPRTWGARFGPDFVAGVGPETLTRQQKRENTIITGFGGTAFDGTDSLEVTFFTGKGTTITSASTTCQ